MKKETYIQKALERDITLFKWKSDSLKLPLNPEFYVTELGALGFDIKNKRWIRGTFTGLRDEYGDFVEFVGTDLSSTPETYHLRNHEEVIVCGNTPLYRPFIEEREFYAEMKEETDISIECQLVNSRLNKAWIAESDQKKKQIEEAYKAVKKGLPVVIVTKLLEELNTVDLTDPNDIEKMQYLSSFYQTLEKREANDYGVDLEILDKRAQVSTSEIKQYDDVTTQEYLIMYEMRLRFVEEMKENGFDIEIVRNPVFFDEPTKEDIDDGEFEAAKTEEIPETPEENKEEVKDNAEDENN